MCEKRTIWPTNVQFSPYDLIFELYLAILKVNIHAKNVDASARYSGVIPLTDTQLDIQTDENITVMSLAFSEIKLMVLDMHVYCLLI